MLIAAKVKLIKVKTKVYLNKSNSILKKDWIYGHLVENQEI
jgi:hypothetical protein